MGNEDKDDRANTKLNEQWTLSCDVVQKIAATGYHNFHHTYKGKVVINS